MVRITLGSTSGEYMIHWPDGRVQFVSSFWQILCVGCRLAWSGHKVVVDA